MLFPVFFFRHLLPLCFFFFPCSFQRRGKMRCKRERAHSSFFLLLRLKKTALLSKLYRKKNVSYKIDSFLFCLSAAVCWMAFCSIERGKKRGREEILWGPPRGGCVFSVAAVFFFLDENSAEGKVSLVLPYSSLFSPCRHGEKSSVLRIERKRREGEREQTERI